MPSRLIASAGCFVALIGVAGCQVELPSGRKVSMQEIHQNIKLAEHQLNQVAARLDVEQWRYFEMPKRPGMSAKVGHAPQTAPSDEMHAHIDEPTLHGSRIQYIIDKGHKRLAMHIKPLAKTNSTSQPTEARDFEPSMSIQLIQRTSEGDELTAERFDNGNIMIRLHRKKDGPRSSWTPIMNGVYSEVFFNLAQIGGTLKATQEDGLELVRVSWSAFGTTITGWFHPDQGFRIHRIENRDWLGRLHGQTTASEFRDVNGFRYPFIYETRSWGVRDPSRLTSISRYKVHSAEFDATNVTDEDFKIDVLAGEQIMLEERHGNKGTLRVTRVSETMRTDVESLYRIAKQQTTDTIDFVAMRDRCSP